MARRFRRGVAVPGPFGCRCLIIPAMLRFHLPLIEPDVRISRIRLSEKTSRLLRGAPSGASGRCSELLGSSPISGPVLLRTPPSTGVPSLPWSDPASSGRRTPPPPPPARPGPRGLPVGYEHNHHKGLPVFRMRSLGTYRRHYPGGTGKRRWSLDPFPMAAFAIRSWLGSRINSFEACSAFTHVTVCPVAKSPESDPLHPRLRRICYLLHRSDCYRLERPSCRTGLAPARSHRLATAHFEESSAQEGLSRDNSQSVTGVDPLIEIAAQEIEFNQRYVTVRQRV